MWGPLAYIPLLPKLTPMEFFLMCGRQKKNFYAFCPRAIDSYVAESQKPVTTVNAFLLRSYSVRPNEMHIL